MHGISVYLIIFLVFNGHNERFVSSKEEYVQILHFRNKDSYNRVDLKNLHSLKLNKEKALYIVVDGFLSNFEAAMSQSVKNALLENRPNSNVFIVDWSKLSGFESLALDDNLKFTQLMMVYNIAKAKVGFVGEKIAVFLAELVQNNLTDYSQVHIIGYSCGAHIAGVAGMIIQERYNGRIMRITGLDPAGQGFPMKNPSGRLDKSDAEFVDIYHTNRYITGDMEQQVGHVDIYINGGKTQPGCVTTSLVNAAICNHAFSWKTWNNCMSGKCEACPCYSKECQNCNGACTNGITVGLDISLKESGDYYLSQQPFKSS